MSDRDARAVASARRRKVVGLVVFAFLVLVALLVVVVAARVVGELREVDVLGRGPVAPVVVDVGAVT